MYKGKKIAAVVPARKGSKGIKNKNIINLAGIPLIGHTLQCINDSKIVDFAAISTDSTTIAEISRKWLENIIWRPKALATDDAIGTDVIKHAISYIKENIGLFDYYLYLQPTSPLRTPEDIISAVDLATKKNASFVVSVSECEYNPLLANKLPKDNSLKGFIDERSSRRNRQEMETFYRLNGAIYLISGDAKQIDFFGENSYAYIMPQERSVDIDTKLDLLVAEVLLSEHKKK